jgi:hypothetical protein
VVNLKFLKQISRSLKRSSEPKDCSTAKWIDTKYLYQPIEPGEEARWVQSPNDFSRLFNAYEQSMKLTNGVKPRRWPFYPRGGKSVIPAVNSNAGAVAEPGPQSKLVTETMTVPDQENMNKSIGTFLFIVASLS